MVKGKMYNISVNSLNAVLVRIFTCEVPGLLLTMYAECRTLFSDNGRCRSSNISDTTGRYPTSPSSPWDGWSAAAPSTTSPWGCASSSSPAPSPRRHPTSPTAPWDGRSSATPTSSSPRHGWAASASTPAGYGTARPAPAPWVPPPRSRLPV
jgi:hypothetical protein